MHLYFILNDYHSGDDFKNDIFQNHKVFSTQIIKTFWDIFSSFKIECLNISDKD